MSASPWRALAPALFALLLGSAVFLTTLWSAFSHHHVYNDDFLWYASDHADPSLWKEGLLSTDTNSRYRPGCFLLLLGGHLLCGLDQGNWFTLSLLLHVVNGIVLFFLARQCRAGPWTAMIAALLFITSSLNWTAMGTSNEMVRYTTLLLFMTSILAVMRAVRRGGEKVSFFPIVAYGFILVTIEDGATLPIVLGVAAWIAAQDAPKKHIGSGVWLTISATLLMFAGFLLYAKFFVQNQGYELYYGWHSVQKLGNLLRDALSYLFVPKARWGLPGPDWLRYGPLAFFGLSTLWFWGVASNSRREDFVRENIALLGLGLLWVAVTILPALARPSRPLPGDWYNRYFYVPSVGIFLIAGVIGAGWCRNMKYVFKNGALGKAVGALGVVFLALFGITGTVLNNQSVIPLASRVYAMGEQEAGLFFGLYQRIHGLGLDVNHRIRLHVENAPIAKARLEKLLEVSILPRVQIVENAEDLQGKGPPAYKITHAHGVWGNLRPA